MSLPLCIALTRILIQSDNDVHILNCEACINDLLARWDRVRRSASILKNVCPVVARCQVAHARQLMTAINPNELTNIRLTRLFITVNTPTLL